MKVLNKKLEAKLAEDTQFLFSPKIPSENYRNSLYNFYLNTLDGNFKKYKIGLNLKPELKYAIGLTTEKMKKKGENYQKKSLVPIVRMGTVVDF